MCSYSLKKRERVQWNMLLIKLLLLTCTLPMNTVQILQEYLYCVFNKIHWHYLTSTTPHPSKNLLPHPHFSKDPVRKRQHKWNRGPSTLRFANVFIKVSIILCLLPPPIPSVGYIVHPYKSLYRTFTNQNNNNTIQIKCFNKILEISKIKLEHQWFNQI